jgi:hypothetical protein
MTTGRILSFALALGVMALVLGCGQKSESNGKAKSAVDASSGQTDREQIQTALTEAITRWHYGDKAALYDNEFEYLQDKYSFDEYLTFRQIEYAEADTVTAINVQDVTPFGHDSAMVKVEIVFTGPSGKISKDYDKYIMYHHRGRWIRPTVGTIEQQNGYDAVRHQADSAAEAEARESGKG